MIKMIKTIKNDHNANNTCVLKVDASDAGLGGAM